MKRCLPQNVAQPHIIRDSVIIGRSPTSFAKGKHHFKKALANGKCLFNQPRL